MFLTHLSLTNVRTFRRLEFDLTPGVHVVCGENGSGKTNLLETIALIATARLPGRTGGDADLLSWDAIAEEALPAARVAADVSTASGPVALELVVAAREPSSVLSGDVRAEDRSPAVSRRFRVNGIARRASDLIGRLRVVLFSAEDMQIIVGPPSGRRRYLDITISQMDREYVRALQRYARVLEQRNSLLRALQERRGATHELDFWDEELSRAGAIIVQRRVDAVTALGTQATAQYAALAPTEPRLVMRYRPALPDAVLATLDGTEDALTAALQAMYAATRGTDVRAGVTRAGPHRDDLSLAIGGHEVAAFASRGQQRTVALALRLAEVELSQQRTGDAPVLLLDDVLSELDAAHRERVLSVAYGVDQVLITTPDPDRPAAGELRGAVRYALADGMLLRTDEALRAG